MSEKRQHARYTVMCKAECINTEVDIINISKQGMKIKSEYRIISRNDIPFNVVLPDLDIINIVGDILREEIKGDNNYIYGVKIKDLSGEHESTFNTFLLELNISSIET